MTERIRSWLASGIEAQAIGVMARSASLVREARKALRADGIATASLNGPGGAQAVRAGTMHARQGLEFQAVAVIGVEQGLIPEPTAVTPATEDAVAHAQDVQRERCVLFVACTRAPTISTSPPPASRVCSCRARSEACSSGGRRKSLAISAIPARTILARVPGQALLTMAALARPRRRRSSTTSASSQCQVLPQFGRRVRPSPPPGDDVHHAGSLTPPVST